MNLEDYGWNSHFEDSFKQYVDKQFVPGRVIAEHRQRYRLWTELGETGEMWGEVSGRFIHTAQSQAEYPTVGDWVVLKPDDGGTMGIIQAVLPRKSCFSRKAVMSGGNPDGGGKTDQQAMAANIDYLFLVVGLDGDFNIRRLERYITAAWDSGSSPVVVLNKIDLCTDLVAVLNQVEEVSMGIPILTASAKELIGLDAFQPYLQKGKSSVFLGSSGVGKSSLINALLGEEKQLVKDLREDDSRGRHTTTHRELLLLPGGGMIVDTPGLRELQIWSDGESTGDGIRSAFHDIEELFADCRFHNCQHQSEPGCAVQLALAENRLDNNRYQNYLKLQREAAHLEIRRDKRAQRQAQKEWGKKISKFIKERKKVQPNNMKRLQ